MTITKDFNRYRGCLLGLAVGDALGTSLEFQPRGSFPVLTDLIGGGVFSLQPGQWTDDTSMALCLAESLVQRRGFDATDQMNRYVRWYRTGYLSSTGACFDIGNATRQALHRFEALGDPWSGSTDPTSAGNGSLMRLAPIPMFYASDLSQARHYAAESSRTTHAALECLDACQLYAEMLVAALAGSSKDQILSGCDLAGLRSAKVIAIGKGGYRGKSESEIRGSGYVIACLEAALWCFETTDSYAAAVLRAANLGDDADTTAAVCGQLAGAFYGQSAIPPTWLEKVYLRNEIIQLADALTIGPSGEGL